MKLNNFLENYFPGVSTLAPVAINFYDEPTVFHQTVDLNKIISWPPNIFLILYSILEYTDKYRLIVSPQEHFSWKKEDLNTVNQLATQWLGLLKHQINFLDDRLPFHAGELKKYISVVFNHENFNISVYELLDRREFAHALFVLFISVDEAFETLNLCDETDFNIINRHILIRKLFMNEYENLSDNHGQFGFVTLKSNVPQSGLTINNLTQHLTVIKPSVKPKVVTNTIERNIYNKKSYNVLILPWPMEISHEAFLAKEMNNNLEMDEYFGFFEYKPGQDLKPQDFISVLISAIKRVRHIDLIILPECSLTVKAFERFQNILFECFGEKAPSLLAGVYGDDNAYIKNSAKLAFIGESKNFDSFEQKKHHRWFLDKNQLRNYNLSSSLEPNRKWWENISVSRRNLLTLHTLNGIKLCPLICEDLARQEPVAQAVRAMGPNLVVCLLLDGPQLSNRWPGKYAAVLADDPGSSVLSLTALGMTLRATGLGHPPSREVALWSEPGQGSETLILDDSAAGIVIELEMKDEKMWTMDGRYKTKPVLRKLFHTSISFDNPSQSVNMLKQTLIKELKRGGTL